VDAGQRAAWAGEQPQRAAGAAAGLDGVVGGELVEAEAVAGVQQEGEAGIEGIVGGRRGARRASQAAGARNNVRTTLEAIR
jgi:hypothetical protein